MAGKNYYKIIRILILICILFSLLSCGDERSIFWTIIKARKEKDNSLDNTLSIVAMTEDGTNYYISAGGSIWWQEMSLEDDQWKKVKFPGKGVLCTALASFGSSLYAGFILDNGDERLFTTTNPTAKSPDWTNVTDTLVTDKQIIKLMQANSLLFISVQEQDSNYSLYYYNGADFFSIHDNVTDKSKPILDIGWNGSVYWTISGSKIYELNASLDSAVEIDSIDSDGDFTSVLYQDSSGDYYVSSEKGNIYIYDGSEWHYLGKDDLVEIGGKVVAFTDLAEVNGNILIGTQGYGFFETRSGSLDDLDRAGEKDDMDSILSSDLYTSHVLSLYETATNRVFFCTGGNGLYHNTYNGEKWAKDWIHE
ncbi:MAG: hypothetical protein JXB88_23570 [Spirochaetales bacterium]|nr:hypothetical protein [Spirochaetales bacterium]